MPRIATTPRLEEAAADWRAFAARRYRPFRALAVGQGFIGALTGPAIVIPLLLELGAHPALATALAVLPIIGTVAQRVLPGLLDRTDGNLRGITILFATLGEPRGLLLAVVVGLTAPRLAAGVGRDRARGPALRRAWLARCRLLRPDPSLVRDHPAGR